MKLNVMIVDDLSSDRSRLNSDISACLSEKKHLHWTIQCFSCAQQMLDTATYSFDSPRIAFLDICMDKMNGIQLARELRSNDPELLIIFLTTSREYAFDAFPLHAFDYLLKPYTVDRLSQALDEALQALSFQKAEPEILIRAAYNSLCVPYSKIISVLSYGHSVEIYTTDGSCIRSIMTFHELEKALSDDSRFLCCNRGVLVNMDHVLDLYGNIFHMEDGPACSLRVRDRTTLISKFSQYQISRMKGGVRS